MLDGNPAVPGGPKSMPLRNQTLCPTLVLDATCSFSLVDGLNMFQSVFRICNQQLPTDTKLAPIFQAKAAKEAEEANSGVDRTWKILQRFQVFYSGATPKSQFLRV